MKPLSVDLRERIVMRYEAGGVSQAEVAEQFNVHPRTLANYLKLYRQSGSLEPKAHGGGPPPKLDPSQRERLRRYVEQHPDATLEALREMLKVPMALSTLHGTLAAMGARIKKKPSRQ